MIGKQEYDKSAFNCPFCNVFANQEWFRANLIDKEKAEIQGVSQSKGRIDEYSFSKCYHCENISIWDARSKSLIFPISSKYNFNLSEVPEEIASDYTEAIKVLTVSPKASAALSRRCLQLILRSQGFKDSTLYHEIQNAIDSRQVPTYISESLDAVRTIGNFGSHPLKNKQTGEIVDVEEGEADWNIEVLEALMDFYYTQPAKLKKRKSALNEKLKSLGKNSI